MINDKKTVLPPDRFPLYDVWIADFIAKYSGHVAGLCSIAAADISTDFPELEICNGVVEVVLCLDLDSNIQEHWWCSTKDGVIVDPTVIQFDRYGGVVRYEELNRELTSGQR